MHLGKPPAPPRRQRSARRVVLPMDVSALTSDGPQRELAGMLNLMHEHDQFGWFAQEVTVDIAPDYHTVIKAPMAIALIATKIATLDASSTSSRASFERDCRLMLANARLYNDTPTHAVHVESLRLEAVLDRVLSGEIKAKPLGAIPPPPAAPPLGSAAVAAAPQAEGGDDTKQKPKLPTNRARAAAQRPAKRRRAEGRAALRIVLVALERAWYPASLLETDWRRAEPCLVVFHRDGEKRWIGMGTPILFLDKLHEKYQTILPGGEGGFVPHFGEHVTKYDGVCLHAIAATLPFKRANQVELLQELNGGIDATLALREGHRVRLPVEHLTNA